MITPVFSRQRVHYAAPPANRLDTETRRYLDWLNGPSNEPPLLRAGLGHLWVVTLHPLDDGNRRIARVIGDLLLARTQKRSMEVTEWLLWFLETLHRAGHNF